MANIAVFVTIMLVSMQVMACQHETGSPESSPTAVQTSPAPTQTISPAVEPTARIPTPHSTFASFAIACGKLMTEKKLDTWSDAYAAWLTSLDDEIPPPELKDFWAARKAYLALLPKLIPDYTPPELTRAYDLSMQRAAEVSAEARQALLEEGCLDRRQWDAYERKSKAQERLDAMKGTPLESVEGFAQACKDIFATAPAPASLDHRAKTLEHVLREWDRLVPSSDFENLYVAIVHSYRVALAEEDPSRESPTPLDFPDPATEEMVADLLAEMYQAGC